MFREIIHGTSAYSYILNVKPAQKAQGNLNYSHGPTLHPLSHRNAETLHHISPSCRGNRQKPEFLLLAIGNPSVTQGKGRARLRKEKRADG
ncbi:MAG: hypothetical protein ABSG04_14460 [Verrucomicrobiota bacterium]